MAGPIYQCCYTNTKQNMGDTVTSGWQAVDVSPDIPSKVFDTCTKRQNANSSLCANAVDEDGNVLTLYDYFGDGGYMYVIRTQYGLSDRVGRPNMFSHAVIFPLQDDDIFLSPNSYLSLAPDAFKSGEGQQSWDGIPPYDEDALTLQEAMKRAGIDEEKYAVLAKCVYAQMSASKGTDPLYIQYDGTEEQRRGIMFCICAGIPHFMLKTLSAASCPTANDSGKHLVFSKNARARGRWLDPRTGENSVLSQRIDRKISRYGYIDYPMIHEHMDGDVPMFFLNLNKFATAMAGNAEVNGQISKLAFYFWIVKDESKFTDEELESDFSDALRLTPGNIFVEKLLSRMLTEINRRGIRLTAENEALLDTWLSNARSDEFQTVCRTYKTKG